MRARKKQIGFFTQQLTTTMLLMLATINAAQADLPTTSDPSRGSTDGNFIELLQNYAYDIFIFGGLALATLAFFVVAKNVMNTYSEVSTGRSTMGQVAMHAGVGVLLLVFIIFLLTEAAAVL